MQEIMRIGDTFVAADDDIKDIGHASEEITDIAQKYKTDILAVIGKGDTHSLVTQYHERETELFKDIARLTELVNSVSDTYNVNANDVADMIKIVVEKG